MKLGEVYRKPIAEIIEELELSNMEVHTDDSGNVKSIKLEYTEKEPEKEPETKTRKPQW